MANTIYSMDQVQPNHRPIHALYAHLQLAGPSSQGCTSKDKRLILAGSKPGGLLAESSYVQDWPRITEIAGDQVKG